MPTAAALEPQKLPDTSHVDFARVYEPSDDTFLLVDALTADAAALRAVRPAVCVEVGSGSGAVVTHLGRLLAASAPQIGGPPPRHYWCFSCGGSGTMCSQRRPP